MSDQPIAPSRAARIGLATFIRLVRLATGMLLMAFVAGHLGVLALGLVSLETMDDWAPILMITLYHGPGVIALYVAIALHLAAGLYAISRRGSWRMPVSDAAQLALGVAIPVLLAGHVIAIRGGIRLGDFYADFRWMIAFYWKFAPGYGLRQIVVVVVVWTHGCLGLYNWLSLKPWWPRIGVWLYPIAVALPILALLGFVEAGKEALNLLENDAAFIDRTSKLQAQLAPLVPRILAIQDGALAAYAALLATLAGMTLARAIARRRTPMQVAYLGGPSVTATRGLSLLEVSRLNDIAHADVCSGRARCGTCRVRVISGAAALTPAGEVETALLQRLGAGTDVRLACQARLRGGAVIIERLVAVDVDAADVRKAEAQSRRSTAEAAS